MLGSRTEADDAVQEAWLRLMTARRAGLRPRSSSSRSSARLERGPLLRVGALAERLRGLGATEQVALGELAAELAQRRDLRGGLHALGHGAQPQRVGEADDGGTDRSVARLLAQTVHEAAVDLERLDGEPLQVRHRRVPGTEVV